MKLNILYFSVVLVSAIGVISGDDVIINGSTQPDIPSASTVINNSSTPVPPTTTPNTTTTHPTTPPTTPSTTTTVTTTTPTPPTTPSTTTTIAPNVTTTASPNVTTTTESTTAAPTAAPSHKGRKFDGPSFIGGIILASGLMAICFVSWKFYKARTERNYHTL